MGMFLVILCTLLTGCKEPEASLSENIEMARYSAHFFGVFDTQTTVIGYAESQEDFDEKVKKIEEYLKYYHELYDIYHTFEGINNMKTINDNAGIEPVIINFSCLLIFITSLSF